MAALLLSNAANLRTGWGFVRPGGPDDGTNAHRACQIVAEDFSLTQREFEVLRRIVAGEKLSDSDLDSLYENASEALGALLPNEVSPE